MSIFLNKFYVFCRASIIIAPFLVLGWLIKKDLVTDGQVEFVYDFRQDSPAITNLFPANRLSSVYRDTANDFFWQEVNAEPVYFETRLPQTFDRATVEITYQNKNLPLVQVGLQTLGETAWNYDFKPLENQLVDQLSWSKIEDQRGSLWQRQKKYLSFDQFIDDLDNLSNFAAYNYPVNRKFILTGYQPGNKKTVFNKTLRGYHSFYTYIKNEDLDFTFYIQDINRSEGPDYLTVKIYSDKNLKVYEQKVNDDGFINKFDPASPEQAIKVLVPGLPEGAYRVVLDCEDEMFFRQIETKQRYLTFIDRLYLVDNPEYDDGFTDLLYKPTAVYSTMPRLGFFTAHPAGLQHVGVNKEVVEIKETHRDYYLTPKKVPALIYVEKNDLKIFGRGLMALAEDMYFNPEIYDLRDLTELSAIDYLVTDYHTPTEVQGWKTGQVKFDLSNASISNRKLRFVISAPELSNQSAAIPLKEIRIWLQKKPLSWGEFWAKTINYFKKKFL
ncbi:MAG: hypothetical protein UV78_C0011G0010 [Parcubacteria group bacterium GW2011_GWA2_43_17]|nr:MAG: hypothetical protein UV78_C0011G0010 [Parcubacteria group bacterium GW2011_GWA2_43_17]KKT94441.1 MAG: hypothetical protein UW91_C0001G0005 [Parcubacteria group bacterium GW2011_GWF2_45_11]KKT97726.1 MAG: hypothetical protein UW98_C0013G0002 [Parcubacteria group bacterium GW2011_GWC2_45_15]OGY92607.1 MAG: hypothetical protein A2260_01590 [Candidatus Komeilibacteria bacterium RIFOXYA2_FULL_45_9]OGY93865.1 MAG: hypothetical protein A3J95_01730 [Candidatus Komeilibacteria bacterium RIFOXYC2